jgi:phosphohistidine phosphatase
MTVYFLRHGEARAAGSGGDAARALTAAGVARMEREAASMAALRFRVDRVLSSPLVRARQTAEIVARALGRGEALSVDERLSPGFGRDHLRLVLRDHHGAAALMLVGHEPDISAVIGACIGGGSVEVGKGTLARLDFERPGSLSATLAWLLPAHVLER